jgi:Amt family ammonium transporter
MIGGIIGGLLLGLFADKSINAGIKYEGLIIGGSGRLLVEQVFSIVVVLVWSFAATFAIVKVLDKGIGLRVSDEDEEVGLDRSEHAETAYNLGLTGTRVG